MEIKKDKFALFLYLLMRDHVPVGVVGQIMEEIRTNWDNPTDGLPFSYSNEDLAHYCEKLVKELQ